MQKVIAIGVRNIAERIGYNINITKKELVGIITLDTDKLFFEDNLNRRSKELYLQLNRAADSIWYEPKLIEIAGTQVNVIRLWFCYDLYERVEDNQ